MSCEKDLLRPRPKVHVFKFVPISSPIATYRDGPGDVTPRLYVKSTTTLSIYSLRMTACVEKTSYQLLRDKLVGSQTVTLRLGSVDIHLNNSIWLWCQQLLTRLVRLKETVLSPLCTSSATEPRFVQKFRTHALSYYWRVKFLSLLCWRVLDKDQQTHRFVRQRSRSSPQSHQKPSIFWCYRNRCYRPKPSSMGYLNSPKHTVINQVLHARGKNTYSNI